MSATTFQAMAVAGAVLVAQQQWDPRKPRPIVVDRFETLGDLGEGSCRIRYQKKIYVVAECPWMGFRDMKEDTFKIIPRVTR